MRRNNVSTFLLFLLLSVVIFSLSKTAFFQKTDSAVYSLASFFSKPSYKLFSVFTSFGVNPQISELKKENLDLTKKIVEEQALISENKSLHDQFETSNPKSLSLLPADVIGSPRFLPGITSPESLVINVGTKDGAKLGSAVVFRNNLVGKITKISDSLSEVTLITNQSLQFAAKTEKGTLGVVKGEGNGDMILDNVLLSDPFSKNEIVATNGDFTVESTNFVPNLIVGKVVSVDKIPSDIFQRGKLQSFIDFSKLTEVFVIKELK